MLSWQIKESLQDRFGIDDFDYLGGGEFGEAYCIGNDKVLKLTTDANEFTKMYPLFKDQQERLLSGESEKLIYENSIKIHNMLTIDDNTLVIIMEKLDTDGVEDVFNSCMCPYDEEDIDEVLGMSIDEMEEKNFDDVAMKMIEDIYISRFKMQRCSGIVNDITPYNIGLNKYNNYVLFDQRNKSLSDTYINNVLKDIKSERLIEKLNTKKDIVLENNNRRSGKLKR